MAEFPSLPLWVDAYLADTSHLTEVEHGRYFLLLLALWRSPGCRMPNDSEWLARRFRKTTAEVEADLRPLIVEFCQITNGWIWQRRLMQEWKWVREKAEKNRRAAKQRWDNENILFECTPDAQQPLSERNAPTPTPTPTPRKRHAASELEAEFEEQFWPLYPRKQAKGQARRAFAAARLKAELPSLLDGVRRLIAERREEKFIPHAATWLNGERWLDQSAAAAAASVLRPMTPEQRAASDRWWHKVADEQERTGSYGGKEYTIPKHIQQERRERKSA